MFKLRIRVNLLPADSGYRETHKATLLGGNIKPDDPISFPHIHDQYINFKSQTSIIYDDNSNGIVNTRFSYPYAGVYAERNNEGKFFLYAKLGWFERRMLRFIEGDSWLQKHPLPTLALIGNIILGGLNIFLLSTNNQNSINYPEKIGIQLSQEQLKEIQNTSQYEKQYNDSLEIIDTLVTEDSLKQ